VSEDGATSPGRISLNHPQGMIALTVDVAEYEKVGGYV
jgi:hypothetical protein